MLQHWVFSLHFFTFFMLLLMLLSGMLHIALGLHGAVARGAAHAWSDAGVSVVVLLMCGGYLGLAARTTYGESFWKVALKTAGLVVLLYPSLVLYRLFLFFVVHWLT